MTRVTRAEYDAEIERRNRLVDAAGLAKCEWLAARSNFSELPPDTRAVQLPTSTLALWQRILVALLKLREWSHPAILGALGIGAIVFLRVVFMIAAPGFPIGMGLAVIIIGLGLIGAHSWRRKNRTAS